MGGAGCPSGVVAALSFRSNSSAAKSDLMLKPASTIIRRVSSLLFPLVFAMCIGSDYGLHLLCSYKAIEEGSGPTAHQTVSDRVWATTGRAIAIAAVTDAAVFLIYAAMELVSASQIMLSVALAVAAVFLSTIVLVPALKR